MTHRAVQWADQGERPLRGVNVAEVIGTALKRSLVLVTVRHEERDRRIGEYLETYCLVNFQCSVEQRRARRRSATRVPADVRSAASYFASRLEGVSDVRAVVLEIDDGETRLLTYIRRRDTALRSRIYSIEREVYEIFSGLALDFRVVSLDSAKCSLPAENTEGAHVLLLR